MTSRVTASKAKTELLSLLTRVESGETITITRHGKPIAYLGPVSREQLHVQSLENEPDEPATGVLRAAPGAADRFPRPNPPEEPVQPPARITQQTRSTPATGEGSQPPPPAPQKPANPVGTALTLADILRAAQEP